MNVFKKYPLVELVEDEGSSAMRIVTSRGDIVVVDINCDTEMLERIVECWNAVRDVAFPTAHMAATNDYIVRLESLRSEAVSELERTKNNLEHWRHEVGKLKSKLAS